MSIENKKKVICFGEVLWDVVADRKLIGGAPLNVCYHLSKNGIDAKIISQVGNDAEGKELLNGIKNLGVDSSLIDLSPKYPTSKVLVKVLEDGKVGYDIVKNVAWDFISFNEDTAKEIAISDFFVYGSLSSRSLLSKQTLLSYLAHANWKVLDLNLRKPFFDKETMHSLLSTCNTLKINDEELLVINDFFFEKKETQQMQIDAIFDMFANIKELILTKGAAGASYHTRQENIEMLAIKVVVADTVGSGDSFLAAYLAGKLNGKPVRECLQDSIALSAFIASKQGACPPYKSDDILSLKR